MAKSWRTRPMPKGWARIRLTVLRRANFRCAQCGRYANQVDHISGPDSDELSNLQALCEWHHASKTGKQGRAAQLAKLNRRPEEPHPGLR